MLEALSSVSSPVPPAPFRCGTSSFIRVWTPASLRCHRTVSSARRIYLATYWLMPVLVQPNMVLAVIIGKYCHIFDQQNSFCYLFDMDLVRLADACLIRTENKSWLQQWLFKQKLFSRPTSRNKNTTATTFTPQQNFEHWEPITINRFHEFVSTWQLFDAKRGLYRYVWYICHDDCSCFVFCLCFLCTCHVTWDVSPVWHLCGWRTQLELSAHSLRSFSVVVFAADLTVVMVSCMYTPSYESTHPPPPPPQLCVLVHFLVYSVYGFLLSTVRWFMSIEVLNNLSFFRSFRLLTLYTERLLMWVIMLKYPCNLK